MTPIELMTMVLAILATVALVVATGKFDYEKNSKIKN